MSDVSYGCQLYDVGEIGTRLRIYIMREAGIGLAHKPSAYVSL